MNLMNEHEEERFNAAMQAAEAQHERRIFAARKRYNEQTITNAREFTDEAQAADDERRAATRAAFGTRTLIVEGER